jgi:hypothetical protein
MKRFKIVLILVCILFVNTVKAQIDESQMGFWNMYFFNADSKIGGFGVQGDIQHRNWAFGDLEQLLLRGGVTYKPENAKIKFTLGYGNITTGTYGSSKNNSGENRTYFEALYPVKVGKRFNFNHRFRYETRWVESQDLRTRYRFNLMLNIPLNNTDFSDNTLYISLYDELFINGQRNIGNNQSVEVFDRNRAYVALGYKFNSSIKLQVGAMQQATDNWTKNQLQFSLHHSF